jgi:enoyl-CoA hydratase
MQTILAGYADLNVLIRGVDDGRRLFRAFADFPKPLVAAVHGNSFGVATSLIFTADAIVTTPAVRLSDPHVHVGLVAGDGGCVTSPLSAGLARAKRACYGVRR